MLVQKVKNQQKVNKKFKMLFPENFITRVTCLGIRLSSKFTKIKDKPVKEHQHDIFYYVKCPESQCSEDYTAETARRCSESVLDHNDRDAKSHLVKHAIEKCHKYPKNICNILQPW